MFLTEASLSVMTSGSRVIEAAVAVLPIVAVWPAARDWLVTGTLNVWVRVAGSVASSVQGPGSLGAPMASPVPSSEAKLSARVTLRL